MRASFSVINVVSTGLKRILGRRRTSRFFSSGNLSLASSFLLEDEGFIFEDSKSINDPLPNVKSISTESREHNEPSFNLNDIFDLVDNETFICEHQNADGDELTRIKLILANRGWDLSTQHGYRIDLNQHNVMRMLNDVFEESSDAALALYFFCWLECCTGSEHKIGSICTMIHILVAGNMNYRAIDLILCLVRKNDGDDLWHNLLLTVLRETHTERRVLVTACSMLVDCYVKENMANVALKLTCQMKPFNIFPSIGVCNSLLRALLDSDKLELAWNFLEEMQRQGLGFNASIISLFIYKYCTEGNLEVGLKFMMEMKKHGIHPDVVAYTIVINSLCKMSHLREATSLLFKMIQMGISLDSVSLSSVIDGFCKVGKPEKAVDLLKIYRVSPNIYMYNSFISRLCIDGDMIAASNIFNEMSEFGLVPDCCSYTTIIGGYCKVGEINEALSFMGKMLKRRIKPSVTTYTMLIDGYCKSGDMDMADHLFQKMITDDLVPDIVAYNTLVDGYGKKGHLHKVFELLDIMRSAEVSPDIVTYNTVIHSLTVRGFVNEAKDLFDELINRGFSPDVVTFTSIISGLSKKGNFEEAFLVWLYMSEDHMKPDVVMCSALLNGYCRARCMEKANALFCKMLDIGLIPDLMLFNTLIHGFCSVGNIEDACHLVNMMVEHGIIPNEGTHQALVLGFEKKWAKNPVAAATFKLQQILLKYGVQVDS